MKRLPLFLFLLLGAPCFAQVAFVNSVNAHATNATVVTTGTLAVTHNNLVLIACFQNGDSNVPISQTSSAGVSGNHILGNDVVSPDGTLLITYWQFVWTFATGNIGSLSCNWGSSESSVSIIVRQYSGNSLTFAIDVGTVPMTKGVWNATANTGVTSGQFSTVNAQENIIVCGLTSSTTQTFSVGNIAGSAAGNLVADGAGGSETAACEDLAVSSLQTNQTGAMAWSSSAQGGVDVVSISTSTSCPPPVITVPLATSAAGGRSWTVTWTTDISADSLITWSKNAGGNSGTPTAVTDAGGVTSHSVTINNTFPGNIYGFGIRSRNVATVLCTTRNQAWGFVDGGDTTNLIGTANAASAGSFDYQLDVEGAHSAVGNPSAQHCVQGFGCLVELFIGTIVGTYPASGVQIVLTSSPTALSTLNVSLAWPDTSYFATNGTVSTTTFANDTYTQTNSGVVFSAPALFIKTNQGGTTPKGTYTLTFTASAANGSGAPSHSITTSLIVDGATSPYGVSTAFNHTHGNPPAIPNLVTFQNTASTWGAKQCAQDSLTASRVIRRSGFLQTVAASVGSGTSTVLVQDTTQYSANTSLALAINYPDSNADYESIASGSWSVVDGTHLSITFANSHTGPFKVQLSAFQLPTNSQFNWYYDGARVFSQLATFLGQPLSTWQPCIDNINEVYRDHYVIHVTGGNIGNYFNSFTNGVYADYQNNGQPSNDFTAVNLIDQHWRQLFGFGGSMGGINYLQRETAYSLTNTNNANLLGISNTSHGQNTAFMTTWYLENVLFQMDQMCVSQDWDYFEFFMAGLQMDALIRYYTTSGNKDPRIPAMVKACADYLYTAFNSIWNDPNAFPYDSYRWNIGEGSNISGGSSMEQLNMLIAPAYAWLWMMTGDYKYQVEADTIFNQAALFLTDGGPQNLFTSNGTTGKLFNQQYYWGTNFVTWRNDPATGSGSGPAPQMMVRK